MRVARADLWICLALLLATFAVYSRAGQLDFVNFDDPDYVSNNLHLKEGLSADGIGWAFTSAEGANWFPLTRLSYLIEFRFFGLAARGYHLTNVVIHALASVVLFLFLLRAANRRWPAAFVAFVFALHPLHVESVAWVSERKDVLCAFFWFLALWAWVRYTERPAWRAYCLALLFFILGLMSKPMIVTLPFTLLLLDAWPLRRKFSRDLIVEKIPFFALAPVSAVVTYLAQKSGGAVQSLSKVPLGLRIENALLTSVVYIAQTFWPARLAAIYPYPKELPPSQPAAAGLALVCMSLLVLRSFQSRPYLAVGWFWYLGTLVPVIGLVQVGVQARADRYMYVPMVGLSIMLAWTGADVVRQWPRTKTWFAATAAAALIALAPVAWLQIQYWKNGETLFRHAIAVTGGNLVAYLNLSAKLAETPRRLPEEVELLTSALRIDSNDERVLANLGAALIAANVPANLPVALAYLRKAVRVNPGYALGHIDLAGALLRTGHADEALTEAAAGLRIEPESALGHDNLGNALFMLGRWDDAIAQFRLALRINPEYVEAHNDLGAAIARVAPDSYSALVEFEEALRIQPDYRPAHINLASVLLRIPDRRAEAISHLRTALRIEPDPALQKTLEELEARQPRATP